MVQPNWRYKGLNPIRGGRRWTLGYEVSGAGAGRYYVEPRGIGGAKKASWYPLDEAGWASAWRSFEQVEPGPAADYRRKVDPLTRPSTGAAVATVPPSPMEAATRRLSGLLVGGGFLSLIGAALFLACWLARSSALADGADPGNSSFFIVVGALVSVVGEAMLLVGLIGWGVKLGREAADV
jgi:hypothetical protein